MPWQEVLRDESRWNLDGQAWIWEKRWNWQHQPVKNGLSRMREQRVEDDCKISGLVTREETSGPH